MPEFEARDKVDKQDIVFEAIRKIMEKSSKEFKAAYEKIIDHGTWSEKYLEPDSRKEYCQMIEFFSDVMQPYFDEDSKTVYENINKELEKNLSDYDSGKIELDKFVINKTRLMRKMFQQLNFLLVKTDYLRKKAKAG